MQPAAQHCALNKTQLLHVAVIRGRSGFPQHSNSSPESCQLQQWPEVSHVLAAGQHQLLQPCQHTQVANIMQTSGLGQLQALEARESPDGVQVRHSRAVQVELAQSCQP